MLPEKAPGMTAGPLSPMLRERIEAGERKRMLDFTRDIDDLTDIAAGTGWLIFALTAALLEKRLLDAERLVEIIGHLASEAERNGETAMLLPLQEAKRFLLTLGGVLPDGHQIDAADLAEVLRRVRAHDTPAQQ